ncbi:MAG: hypothetical protein JRJ82_22670 [Deltaproteobacteria bacterium]|nr:hypothetical protein [Deltaproteobacteria bacterium]
MARPDPNGIPGTSGRDPPEQVAGFSGIHTRGQVAGMQRNGWPGKVF